MKLRKNYNQAAPGGNGTVEVAETDPGFDAWVIPEGGIEGVETGEGAEQPEALAEGSEEAPAGEENKPGEKPAEKTEGEKKEGEEQPATEGEGLDDDTLPALKDEEDPEVEATWEDIGKLADLPEIEDKNLQGQEKFVAQIKKVDELAYQRGKAEAEALDLKKYSPAEQNVLQALNAGMKIEDVLKPAHAFYSTASATDEDLMLLHFKTNLKQSNEVAQDSVAVLEANGTLRIEADRIRAALISEAEKVVNDNIKTYSEKYAQERDRIAKETERENQALKTEIMGREIFMDGKLTKEAKEALVKRVESGYYKNLMMNDPKRVADFILFTAYGESQMKKIKEAAGKTAKKQTFQRLANTSNVQGGSQASPQAVAVDDFSAWENARPTGIEHG